MDLVDYSIDQPTPNDFNPIVLVSYLAAAEGTLSMRILAALARTCRRVNKSVQWRLTRGALLRQRLWVKFAAALYTRYINNPFKYEFASTIGTPVDVNYNSYGIRFLDTQPPIQSCYPGFRLAIGNIRIIAKKPIGFSMMLSMDEQTLVGVQAEPDDYVAANGQYLVNLNLPLQINPLPLGPPFVDFSRVQCSLLDTQKIEAGEEYYKYTYSHRWAVENFTTVVVDLYWCSMDKYDWGNYAINYTGDMKSVRMRSLVTPI